MSHDVSRRGLLGLMAAAPVAAVAKPLADGGVVFDRPPYPTLKLRDAHDAIYRGAGGAGDKLLHTLKINVDTSQLNQALEAARELADFRLRNHPSPSRVAADDQGPGAPVESLAAERPQPKAARSGAPAPDGDNPILKYVRAC